MAAYIEDESGISVSIDSGGKIGEFTVWVNGKLVEEKDKLRFPDRKKILASVQQALRHGLPGK